MISELLDQIYSYLNGHCTLQNIEEWLLSNMQRILDSGDNEAIKLANQLDADYIELGERLIDEKTLLENLQYLVYTQGTILNILKPQPTVFTDIASNSTTVRAEMVDLGVATVHLNLSPA